MSGSESLSFEFKRYVWNHPERLRERNHARYMEKRNMLEKVEPDQEETNIEFPLIGPGGVRELIERKERNEFDKKKTRVLPKPAKKKPIPITSPKNPLVIRIPSPSPPMTRKQKYKTAVPRHTSNENDTKDGSNRILLTTSHFI